MSVELVIREGIAEIVLNRAEKRNAINRKMLAELQNLSRTIDQDITLRVVIITGAGTKAFSAGGDILEWSNLTSEDFGRQWIRQGNDVIAAIARLRQPVIAVLNGDVLGGGLELAAAADLRIAESHIVIGQPETGLGVIPGWSGTQRAVRRFGAQLVRRMALFGEIYEAEQALALGIVDQVVPSGTGHERAREIATQLCQRGRTATETVKMLINAAEREEQEHVLDSLAGSFVATTNDLHERVKAFRENKV